MDLDHGIRSGTGSHRRWTGKDD